MHGGSRVCRSLAIIYEFGAPKKATAAIGSRRDWAKCALRISNRSAKRIKYFMENVLFNGPYGGWGPFTSALICSQPGRRGPYRLPPEQLVPRPYLRRSRYRNPLVANERAIRRILGFRPFRFFGKLNLPLGELLASVKKNFKLIKWDISLI